MAPRSTAASSAARTAPARRPAPTPCGIAWTPPRPAWPASWLSSRRAAVARQEVEDFLVAGLGEVVVPLAHGVEVGGRLDAHDLGEGRQPGRGLARAHRDGQHEPARVV